MEQYASCPDCGKLVLEGYPLEGYIWCAWCDWKTKTLEALAKEVASELNAQPSEGGR